MAVRNQLTDKYEAKRVFPNGEVIVGTGDSKEAANKDLKEKLKPFLIDNGPLPETLKWHERARLQLERNKQPKYNAPPLVQIDEIPSPGFEVSRDEDGKVKYEYNPNRKAPVFGQKHLQTKTTKAE